MIRPSAKIISDHLSALVGERNPFTTLKQLQSAGDYISQQFKAMGLSVKEEKIAFENVESLNILGYLEGKASASEELFIVAAHYDTVEGSPGADDNASAVAALLEIARCVKDNPPEHNLLFAGFTLEEYGFIGSRQFAEKARKENLPIRGMIALEMLGYRTSKSGSQTYPDYVDASRYPSTGDFIAVVGNQPSSSLAASLTKTLDEATPDLSAQSLVLPGRGDQFIEVRLSDHSPFWENGFRAVMVTDTAFFRNPNYHQSTDTIDTLDIDFIRDISAGITTFLTHHLNDF